MQLFPNCTPMLEVKKVSCTICHVVQGDAVKTGNQEKHLSLTPVNRKICFVGRKRMVESRLNSSSLLEALKSYGILSRRLPWLLASIVWDSGVYGLYSPIQFYDSVVLLQMGRSTTEDLHSQFPVAVRRHNTKNFTLKDAQKIYFVHN